MARTLGEAAFARDVEAVRALLEAGAAVDARDADGRTALHSAVMVNELAIVELLLRAGADPSAADAVGDVPLHFAAQHPARLPVLRLLLARAPQVVNAVGGAGLTPLHVAVDRKFTAGVEALVARGAEATIADAAGKTALDRARTPKLRALLAGPKLRPTRPVKKRRTRGGP
ncbi:MAG: ankyrin repeat domain-containing protein [Myxococcaceae bacterium]